LTIGIVLEQSQTMNKKIKICAIRLNLRTERFTIEILLYNQTLINLEQCTKLITISYQTYMNKITKLSNQKHNKYEIEESKRFCNQLI